MSRLGSPLALLCQIKPSLMRLLQLPPEVTAYSIRQTLISVFQESTHLSFYGTTGSRELTIRRNWQSIVNYPLHTKRKLSFIGPKHSVKLRLFSYPSIKTYVLGAQKNHLIVPFVLNSFLVRFKFDFSLLSCHIRQVCVFEIFHSFAIPLNLLHV